MGDFPKSSHIFVIYLFSVTCPNLTNPTNGMLTCSLGDDNVAHVGDTCSYTCDTGYMLAGSATRTCQSNSTWTSTDVMCNRGKM